MSNLDNVIMTIAIIGGTGKEGKGLAYRWALAGYEILIGSRQLEKAETAANAVNIMLSGSDMVRGMTNETAAEQGDIVVLTVPYSAHMSMLESIKPYLENKILVDVTVPLVPPKVTKVQLPEEGSAAQQAQAILGDSVRVVSAFQNISYEHLLSEEHDFHCDVLVSGNGKESREVVLKLVEQAGLVGWDAGPIENSVVAEGLTSILIGINKRFGTDSAGIQITGVLRE